MNGEYIHFGIKFKVIAEESETWGEWHTMGCVHECVLDMDHDGRLHPYKASLIVWYPAWANDG